MISEAGVSVASTRSRGGVEVACRVGLHEEDLRCRARVEVFRVTCGSQRVRDGRACNAVPEVGDERDGDVAHDASFPVAFAPRDGGERGLGRGSGGGFTGRDSSARTVLGELIRTVHVQYVYSCTLYSTFVRKYFRTKVRKYFRK